MKRFFSSLLAIGLLLVIIHDNYAQRRNRNSESSPSSTMADSTFAGLEFRSLGPGFMSGRIGDVAIHPEDPNTWYVAVGSGGVWKTTNAGVTFEPIFDWQGSYSIGCVTVDPVNPHIVWVGTGENVGGRHVGYGDGIYRSADGGQTWENMGLKASEHISKIIVHPDNSDVVWVAAQGPLWNKGGERGLYKSTDGGKTWNKTLGDDEWIGVTDLMIDPRNPDWMYAATWQRHRTVASYLGGGPGSGIHRSQDGGETWEELTTGLPDGNMGKIGLAISPQQPDVVYAAIELDLREGGVYRSADRGSTWEKRSDAVAGATGPHYYQELYASPHQFERLYLVDSHMQYSEDGGKTFKRLNNAHKHGDNHAIAFREDDPEYLLVGTDGGLYESFDLGANWRFMENLPITQFYKIALDDAEPFYNIYGGTQDNSTQGGPSQTDNVHGIQNSDWRVVLNWDGHQPATEPGNPDIVYAERQEGTLSRIDMTTGEVVDIQPQPGVDEDYERFNWDSPILVSPHDPKRIYFASQRVWRSDNRGDEWQAISGDLTKDQERFALSIMGRTQSWEGSWDVGAMSNYNTITSLAESPQQEGLIYAGTDDGIVQVTEDGGANWRKIDVGSMSGVPATAFVNDIKADLHDANTVYVVLDNHKYGDFQPYLVKSTDRGRTWQSMASDLPDRTLLWRIVQDHVDENLMFLATEFGIYFTNDGGSQWTELTGGLPTISFRDLAIQKRENDLVAASFGRGIFILDDYTALRNLSEEQLLAEAKLFEPQDADWYVPRSHLSFDDEKGSQGASHFVAPNPPFGAVFTYHLKDGITTQEEQRMKREKTLNAQNQNVPFPGWENLAAEVKQAEPKVWIAIKDGQDNAIRRVEGSTESGFHRVAWDLRYPSPYPIHLEQQSGSDEQPPQGMMVAPGTYTASLYKQVDGEITELSEPVSFEVIPLRKGALEGAPAQEVAQFWRSYEDALRSATALEVSLDNALTRADRMQIALTQAPVVPGSLDQQLHQVKQNLLTLEEELRGNPAKLKVGEKTKPTVGQRLFSLEIGIGNSTYGPTETHKELMAIVQDQVKEIHTELESTKTEMTEIAKALTEAGAPWVEGEPVPPIGPNR